MKKTILVILFAIFVFTFGAIQAHAQTPSAIPVPPSPSLTPCPIFSCPVDSSGNPQFCGANDKWVYDPEVTALGKGGDRARQFVFWTINTSSFDNSPALQEVWRTSSSIMFVLLIIVAILLGAGIIVGQRTNFDFKVKVWPIFMRIGLLLLYVALSYSIILLLIQISDVLMQFFIKGLGGDKIFNVFFNGSNSVDNYKSFVGCSNANPDSLESVRTSKFMIQITNYTYYALSIMMILRKIVLWFLLMVAPFLALLAPFVFVRNTGWIWIGVFFQWACYGPLFGLFLGGIAKIWSSPWHIPFQFVFSKAGTAGSVVYPTAINILYSGPSQKPQLLNSANYVDTFAEYVISLIMLWVALLLPWLLLRIFRDYCCDGIYAMKNILLSMYDNMKAPPPSSGPLPSRLDHGLGMKMGQEKDISSKIKIETIEDIKRSRTEDIRSSIQVTATKLTDIAKFETNKTQHETVTKNLEYLQNPLKAETPSERQKFMTMRTELFDRATKGDVAARQTLAAISSSKMEQVTQKEKILGTIPQQISAIQTASQKAGITQEKTISVVKSVYNNITNNNSVVNNIATNTQTTVAQTHSVLQAAANQTDSTQAATSFVPEIAKQTGVSEAKVKQILTTTSHIFKDQKELVAQVAEKEQLKVEQVEKVVESHAPAVAEPEKNIEQTVAIPASVSIEDYEEVKNMWIEQYEKGEIPVTENITSRGEWVDNDVVAITNIMNKILSSDEKLRNEGLDEVSYILPIFMINNMKGEELMVYLKAKLEAAKQVKKDLQKEEEIMDKLKSKEEEVLVDLPVKKKEEAKTMELSEELPIEDEKKPEEVPQNNSGDEL